MPTSFFIGEKKKSNISIYKEKKKISRNFFLIICYAIEHNTLYYLKLILYRSSLRFVDTPQK